MENDKIYRVVGINKNGGTSGVSHLSFTADYNKAKSFFEKCCNNSSDGVTYIFYEYTIYPTFILKTNTIKFKK